MNRSTVLVGIAIVLGLLGTVLGFVALGSSDDGYDDLTLELRGGEEIRSESSALHAEPENQPTSYGAEQKVSGDRTGEYIRVCEPVADDNFQCIGSFLLEDGSITFSGTSKDENPVVNAVTGGTGAYAGVWHVGDRPRAGHVRVRAGPAERLKVAGRTGHPRLAVLRTHAGPGDQWTTVSCCSSVSSTRRRSCSTTSVKFGAMPAGSR